MNRLILPEAGGPSAHSLFSFLPKSLHNRVVAVDSNPNALFYWETQDIETCLQSEVSLDKLDLLLPSAEVWFPDIQRCSGNEVWHNKLLALQALAADSEEEYVHVPPAYDGSALFARRINSSGSKGVIDLDGLVVTPRYDFETEYVIDYNLDHSLFLPRETFLLSHGRDTACCLLGELHPIYGLLVKAVLEVTKTLNMSGIGNLQLGLADDRLVFVEIACRLSGSSWVNRDTANLWTGEVHHLGFGTHNVSVQAAMF